MTARNATPFTAPRAATAVAAVNFGAANGNVNGSGITAA